jgi:hypothetical protein
VHYVGALLGAGNALIMIHGQSMVHHGARSEALAAAACICAARGAAQAIRACVHKLHAHGLAMSFNWTQATGCHQRHISQPAAHPFLPLQILAGLDSSKPR